jgi:hypothetical protein
MARTLNENMKEAGRAVTSAAKSVGNTLAEGAEKATDAVKEMTGMKQPAEGDNLGVAGIKEHMKVFASCGTPVGVVDSVEGNQIKLTRKDSLDGKHHFISTSLIDHVDSHVHLRTNSMETQHSWNTDVSPGGCCKH